MGFNLWYEVFVQKSSVEPVYMSQKKWEDVKKFKASVNSSPFLNSRIHATPRAPHHHQTHQKQRPDPNPTSAIAAAIFPLILVGHGLRLLR